MSKRRPVYRKHYRSAAERGNQRRSKILIFVIILIIAGVQWRDLSLKEEQKQPVPQAEFFEGRVTRVADGDSFEMLHDGKKIRVRLYAIDAPERRQEYGDKAHEVLKKLLQNQVIQVQQVDKDAYNRVIANVRVGDIEVNKHLLAEGWAWHYKRHNQDAALADAEMQAQLLRKGLWQSDTYPVPPWEFRQAQRK